MNYFSIITYALLFFSMSVNATEVDDQEVLLRVEKTYMNKARIFNHPHGLSNPTRVVQLSSPVTEIELVNPSGGALVSNLIFNIGDSVGTLLGTETDIELYDAFFRNDSQEELWCHLSAQKDYAGLLIRLTDCEFN